MSWFSVLCMLETSGKWPEDKEAVQRVKAAFLLKIMELLIKEHHLVCQITAKYLDIFMVWMQVTNVREDSEKSIVMRNVLCKLNLDEF